MGVETRKSHLPAPTDSPVEQTAGESSTEVDFATDISRRTDKTSWTIPEDGREITVPAKKRKDKRDETEHPKGSPSQTSLLIEYFEGGKVHARPSVRVKVTPSSARKAKNTNEHIRVSESKGGRTPSYTRRISLGPHSPTERQVADSADDKSVSSYTSAAEESSLAHKYPPVEIEVMHRDQDSDLSRRSDDRLLLQNPSDVSSMPPDSMLEETHSSMKSSVTPTRNRSPSTSREAVIVTKDTLQTPQRTRSNVSRERLAHRAMEKIAAKSKEGSSGKHRRSSRTSRSRSASNEHVETLTTPRRRSGKHHSYDEDSRSGKDSSLASESQLSANRLSGDQYSTRSGNSRSSINTNPKLLETVENAIKRFVMPELEKIKQEQRVQKSKSRFEQGDVAFGSGDKVSRKLSKHSSAPDIAGPTVVLNRDDKDPGTVLSGDSVKGRKERRRSRKSDSPRERRSERELSEETVIHDPQSASKKRSKESTRLRDSSGGLTTAALQHHDLKHSDSHSTLDSKERRRRRRSKSYSRSASVAESEDVFRKHDVPPMPLQSDIHSSDITRDSILSIDTEGSKSPAYELQHATVRQLARASPREISSPGTRTPTKVQTNLQKSLGTHHSNRSQGDINQKSPLSDRSATYEEKPSIFGGDKAAAMPGAFREHNTYEDTYAHDGRALSPIQSVSSRQESELNRESHAEQQRRRSATSLKSETSLASAAFDHTTRPKGIHLESTDQVLNQHSNRNSEYVEGDDGVDEWLQREHEKNDEYRSSLGEPTVDYKHMTNYTDDSMDAPFLDRVAEGQKQHDLDARKNPDYRSTPTAVESAVASLLDSSVVSNRSKAGDRSFIDSPDKEGVRDSSYSASREVRSKESLGFQAHLSPQRSYLHDTSAKGSPRQSLAQSEASEPVQLGASGVPVADDPIPELEGFRSDSDISTNPSFIQGPMAGTPAGNRDHWPYKPTPPQPQDKYLSDSKRSSAQDSLKARAAEMLAAAQLANGSPKNKPRSRDWSVKDDYQPHEEDNLESYADQRDLASPSKGASPSLGMQSPQVAFKDASTPGLDDDYDPFVATGHSRHLSTNSGLAQGMASPLYDSATGNGIDRIQSKDIVALMDHLTVRDAQRNARDTEILITLVRSAAEMRNSFEEMKKFIAEQDDIMVEAGNKQHDRTIQKIIIGGPRPPPPNFTRRSSAEDSMDTPTKRQNVFRRALKGLSSRNQNDVGRIEDMLEHLLAEVDTLKTAQNVQPLSRPQSRAKSLDSYHQMRATDPEEYATQATSGSPSGNKVSFYPSPTGRGPSAVKPMVDRQASANRVSTVLEADEELDDHEQQVLGNQFENNEGMLTPTKDRPFIEDDVLATPPQARLATAAANATTKSYDNTPKSSDEKSRKHKSTSSSIFPKVSRWSRTTASSFGDNFRSSAKKERPLSEASRSDDLHHYDPQGEDRLPTSDSLESLDRADAEAEQENRPPSPLIPSQVSEDPKYQSHRDSLNLQHPQPRPGPTQRYQRHLESQAQNYGTKSPISPTSDTFGSDPTLSRFMPARYSMPAGGNLSTISDSGYSDKSASEQVAPPRPPKVKDDGPLVPSNVSSATAPARPPKRSTLSQEHLGVAEGEEKRWSGASASEEAKRTPSSTQPPQRKPTGPRPITGSGSWSPDKGGAGGVKRTRWMGSPGAGEVGDETF